MGEPNLNPSLILKILCFSLSRCLPLYQAVSISKDWTSHWPSTNHTFLLGVWYVLVPFWGRHSWFSNQQPGPLFLWPQTLSDQVSGGFLLRGEGNEKQKYATGAVETHFGAFDNVIKQLNWLTPEPPSVLTSKNKKWQIFLSFLPSDLVRCSVTCSQLPLSHTSAI